MKYLLSIYFLISCTLLLLACNDDENNGTGDLTISSPAISNISYNTAEVSTTLSGEESNSIIKKGFCYSTEADPDINDEIVEIQGNHFNATLSGLSQSTTYHVRAFVSLYNAAPIYSEATSLTTLTESIDDQFANYEAPAYPDNYLNISGWANRDEWNLANVHDPTVMKADDGYYYMYQTDASYGNAHDGHGHFHARRSKDLVNWEYMGATMKSTPTWVKEKLNEYRTEMGLEPISSPAYGYWAPVARKVKTGLYRMYYSIVITNMIKSGKPEKIVNNVNVNFDNSWGERAFIGLMETTDPASNVWEDKGFVVCSASDKDMNAWERPNTQDWNAYFKINAIDPTYIITENGEHWMIYGSWHNGIAAMQLNPETGKPLKELGKPWNISGEDNSGYGKIIASRGTSRWQASEGPEIIYRNGYYYLFLAYGGLSVEYNTRVCRSTTIDGEYVDILGNKATSASGLYPIVTRPYKFNDSYGWVGVSHCAVFNDGNDNWYFASQGRFPENIAGINASNAIMMGQIRSIRWNSEGWPVIMPERYGAVPEVPIKESELIGNWEHIAFSANNPLVQQGSSNMVFDANHKVSGSWNAQWSFNAEDQTITLNNGLTLYLKREVDWEATPRVATIVYTAYNGEKTYWGKKVQ